LSAVGVDPASDRARALARNVWVALNHIREVRQEELPDRAALRPGQTSFVYFPRPFNPDDEAILERVDVGDGVIAFERAQDGRWRFSAATVANVAALSRLLAGLPAQVAADVAVLDEPGWVRELVPAALRTDGFIGLRHWQWIGLLVLIFAGIVLDFVVRSLLAPIVGRLLARYQAAVDARTREQAVRAIGLFGAAVFWSLTIGLLVLADPAGAVADSAIGFFAVLAGTLAGWRVADLGGAVMMLRAERTASKFDDILTPLVRKTLKVFIVALGIFYGAQHLNINIVPLLTGLGIGGLAFAFAAKDTIENLFGSVAVVLDQPFEVGDWVVVGDTEGTVEELGFRSTRIRTFYNSLVTMPNAALVRATVDNYGRRQYRRWKTLIGVQYDTTPEQLLAFTEGIRELVRQHPYTRKDYYQVWVNDFGDSSLTFWYTCSTRCPTGRPSCASANDCSSASSAWRIGWAYSSRSRPARSTCTPRSMRRRRCDTRCRRGRTTVTRSRRVPPRRGRSPHASRGARSGPALSSLTSTAHRWGIRRPAATARRLPASARNRAASAAEPSRGSQPHPPRVSEPRQARPGRPSRRASGPAGRSPGRCRCSCDSPSSSWCAAESPAPRPRP
ncbi:MAG: mechanosensitive ion channel, partial [Gemmatimonadota bacterium]|nr:mechanosensitive ion channel [Gemmatimonadota bacterium]